jgi:chromosome segregation ATPase
MPMQQQPQNQISGLLFRLDSVEKDIVSLRQQLNLYEPVRENDLKLQIIKDTTLRIESELGKVKERIESLNAKMVAQEQESVKRDAEQREANDKLQIKVLLGVVSTVLAIGTAVLIGYITHFFH